MRCAKSFLHAWLIIGWFEAIPSMLKPPPGEIESKPFLARIYGV